MPGKHDNTTAEGKAANEVDFISLVRAAQEQLRRCGGFCWPLLLSVSPSPWLGAARTEVGVVAN